MEKSQEGDIMYVVCRKHNSLESRNILGYTIESIHQTKEGAERARDRLRESPFNENYHIWWNSFFLKV